ncbi:MAG: calcium-translocating P-type ATPase, PMCA-type [Bacteroides sp.]|nr:calcium-translocating P-type ATPase, PMCA-type [Bacteroides sp.]MCM1379958.1 calcium-translocating P-type ATPase, PMCA-type [Bacteroides sp.]MCM1446287.1 calcium-translocating P-type ATPase, PMCA-type [Prevotella sp.]
MEKFRPGLTQAQVAESRARYGSNLITPPKDKSMLTKFFENVKDPMIIILLIAGLMSAAISFYQWYLLDESADVFIEPTGIFIAVFLASGLTFYFEQRANHEFKLLNKVNDEEAVQVVRDGNFTEVPKRDIVVGDIVILNQGNDIPADGKLLESTSLSVDESTLTGEPICTKTTDPAHFYPDATFPSDMVLRGTRVVEGHGVMEVTAVGDSTENGKVYTAATIDNGVKTPLSEQLDRLGKLISKISYSLAIIIIVGRMIMYFAEYPQFDWLTFASLMLQSVMVAVTLVVVSVPEGLPMAVTLSLAYSMRRMLKSQNLVRKLHACETMGAVTVICTDKTGTLTENRMTVNSADFLTAAGSEQLINESIAANSTAELDRTYAKPTVLGNPTEGALLLWLESRGEDYAKVRSDVKVESQLPFSSEHKIMATVVERRDETRILYVKGAPERVYAMCINNSGMSATEVSERLAAYQSRAMRTLGFAYQILKAGEPGISDNHITATDLTFMGIVAISDPVRQTVPAAIREVVNSGIKVKIVTGDTHETAKAIAREIRLWHDGEDSEQNILTGEEFEAIPNAELSARAEEIKIIARARPLDKKRLVEALQTDGEVVAVTGDGTNDAPALKAAQVGLSMGDGTSVAKEASDITILDNSFASIGRAVMWGRSLYLNIQQFILFQMTVNIVACLIVLVGSFMGFQSPLTVTQMLWVNLIMDTFAALALASLPSSADVMKSKPRSRSAFIITRSMWGNILLTGSFFFLFMIALLYYFEHTEPGLNTYRLSVFFTTFVFLQFWNMFNARAYATGRSALHLRGCGRFLITLAIIFIGQVAIVELGGQFFGVCPLRLTDWLIIIGGTSAVLWTGEFLRALPKSRKSSVI